MKHLKLYLAGPEVFLSNVLEIKHKKLKICSDFGFTGLFPIDDNLPNIKSKKHLGFYICRHNKQLIKQADGIIANITPYRSVSIDPGTAFELGYADSLNRALFAYTNNPLLFSARVESIYSSVLIDNKKYGNDNFIIEDFDLVDNLMIDGAIHDSTNILLVSKIERELSDLTMFEQTVKKAKEYFDKIENLN